MALKLQVVGLDGNPFSLRVQDDLPCRELLKLICCRLHPKPGAVPLLCNSEGCRLKMTETLKDAFGPRGVDDFVTISYVYQSIVQGP